MNKKEFLFFSQTFLFDKVRFEDIDQLPRKIDCQALTFSKGEHANTEFWESKKIAFILSGECIVMKNELVLNTLKKGDSFGILSVFSNEPYPTAVIAKKETKILFLNHEDLDLLIEQLPAVAMNVIRFLAGRVTFLNRKVATLGEATVEDKCLAFLKEEYQKNGSHFPFSISGVARKIRAGRASLYRALASLEEKGILVYRNNAVDILHPDYIVNQNKEKKQ